MCGRLPKRLINPGHVGRSSVDPNIRGSTCCRPSLPCSVVRGHVLMTSAKKFGIFYPPNMHFQFCSSAKLANFPTPPPPASVQTSHVRPHGRYFILPRFLSDTLTLFHLLLSCSLFHPFGRYLDLIFGCSCGSYKSSPEMHSPILATILLLLSSNASSNGFNSLALPQPLHV